MFTGAAAVKCALGFDSPPVRRVSVDERLQEFKSRRQAAGGGGGTPGSPPRQLPSPAPPDPPDNRILSSSEKFSLEPETAPVHSVLPDALLSVLSVFFRKIFVLQLVGLVLTYNFIDCDFEKIRRKYQEVIYQALEKYMDGTRSTEFSHPVYCADPPDCLARIERLTLHRIRGCASGAREAFAEGTVAALAAECPGYAAAPINNTQAKKKRKKRGVTTNKCREQVAHLIGLWRRFSRIS
ncbi:thymic stromal lymphopoietin [Canis lupus dingo]|uniref:thymic stromal lymphopoietin n=1 Tax=Canis lupus dingo TaxID=286419 RepID=UPI0015F139E6|nr:thymic stromal lymphopoietin [Canis lupus dingo]